MKSVRDKTLLIRKSLTKENLIDVPHILMSKAGGVQLKNTWWRYRCTGSTKTHLSAPRKPKIMKQLGEMVSKLMDLLFAKLGSAVVYPLRCFALHLSRFEIKSSFAQKKKSYIKYQTIGGLYSVIESIVLLLFRCFPVPVYSFRSSIF